MKLIAILSLTLIFSSCCKRGQVKLDGECYWPGKSYETTLTGEVIK